MMKKTLLSVLIAGAFAAPAFAFEPFAVKDIRVEGIQRTEAGTVFSYLPLKVGDVLTDEKQHNPLSHCLQPVFSKTFGLRLNVM